MSSGASALRTVPISQGSGSQTQYHLLSSSCHEFLIQNHPPWAISGYSSSWSDQINFLLCVCVFVLSHFSCVWLLSCSPPGSSIQGIFQARTLEWFAMPSSRRSSWPRDWTCFTLHFLYFSPKQTLTGIQKFQFISFWENNKLEASFSYSHFLPCM